MHEVNITILLERLYINFMINTKFVFEWPWQFYESCVEALQKLILNSYKALWKLKSFKMLLKEKCN